MTSRHRAQFWAALGACALIDLSGCRWVGESDGTLTEHNCAISAVAQRFPEICAAEAKFLAEVLKAEVARREHILSGCTTWEYHVRFHAAEESR